eukprot:1195809-Prorocentrum_minimum.AAC.6
MLVNIETTGGYDIEQPSLQLETLRNTRTDTARDDTLQSTTLRDTHRSSFITPGPPPLTLTFKFASKEVVSCRTMSLWLHAGHKVTAVRVARSGGAVVFYSTENAQRSCNTDSSHESSCPARQKLGVPGARLRAEYLLAGSGTQDFSILACVQHRCTVRLSEYARKRIWVAQYVMLQNLLTHKPARLRSSSDALKGAMGIDRGSFGHFGPPRRMRHPPGAVRISSMRCGMCSIYVTFLNTTREYAMMNYG